MQYKLVAEPHVALNLLTAEYRMVISPGFDYSHLPAAAGACNLAATDQGKLLFLPELGIVKPGLVPVVSNQDGVAANGRPGISHTPDFSAGITGTSAHHDGGPFWRGNHKTAYARADDIDDWDSLEAGWAWDDILNCEALTFNLNFAGGPDSNSLTAAPQGEARWKIGANWYRVLLRLVGETSLDTSTDKSTWRRIEGIPTMPEWRDSQDLPISVMVAANRCCVTIGRVVAFTFPLVVEDPTPTTIDKAEVIARRFVSAQVSVHPRPWYGSATLHSSEINTGITDLGSRPGDVEWRIVLANGQTVGPFDKDGKPTSGLARPTDRVKVKTSAGYPAGSLIAYDLIWSRPEGETADGTWQDEDYNITMPAVRYVLLHIPPVRRALKQAGYYEAPDLHSITVKKEWHPQTLNITTHAVVVVNNIKGNWTSLNPAVNPWRVQGGGGSGLRACNVQFQHSIRDHNGGILTGWWANSCLGVAGMQVGDDVSAGQYVFWFTVDDLSVILKDQELYHSPWLDGWCHYYAIAWAMEQGGLDPDVHLHPAVPRCRNPFCGIATHYHLPMGDGGQPLCDPGAARTPWDVINLVQSHTRHMAFFDRMKRLVYAPWYGNYPGGWYTTPENRDPLSGPRQYTLDTQNIALADLPARPSELHTSINLAETRNRIMVVGLDAYGPRWLPVVAKREEAAAVESVGDWAYKGYHSTGAWLDSRFSSLAYAEVAANRVADFMATPQVDVSLHVPGDPWVEPLMPFVIDRGGGGKRTNAALIPNGFFCTGSEEKWDFQSRQYSMTVTGQNIRKAGGG